MPHGVEVAPKLGNSRREFLLNGGPLARKVVIAGEAGAQRIDPRRYELRGVADERLVAQRAK